MVSVETEPEMKDEHDLDRSCVTISNVRRIQQGLVHRTGPVRTPKVLREDM